MIVNLHYFGTFYEVLTTEKNELIVLGANKKVICIKERGGSSLREEEYNYDIETGALTLNVERENGVRVLYR